MTKHCKLSESVQNYLYTHLNKLLSRLPRQWKEPAFLSCVIKKEPHGKRFTGTTVLTLPRKPLVASYISHSIDEAVRFGFNRIERDLLRYRERHSPRHSKYPYHETIRKHLTSNAVRELPYVLGY